MRDFIEREAAVRAAKPFGSWPHPAVRIECERIQKALRALPSPSCATCEHWAQHRGWFDPAKGDCRYPLYETINHDKAYIPLGWVVTPAAHYCAAYRARENVNA